MKHFSIYFNTTVSEQWHDSTRSGHVLVYKREGSVLIKIAGFYVIAPVLDFIISIGDHIRNMRITGTLMEILTDKRIAYAPEHEQVLMVWVVWKLVGRDVTKCEGREICVKRVTWSFRIILEDSAKRMKTYLDIGLQQQLAVLR